MKIKTSELTGPALDWVVLKCELALHGGWPDDAIMLGEETDYSSSWAVGGPIIEREGISLDKVSETTWIAFRREGPAFSEENGPTPLVAAMRCYVASQLGDEVDVPEVCLNDK